MPSLLSRLQEPDVTSKIKELASEAYPHEFAALILNDFSLVPLDNVRNTGQEEQFEIDPLVWIAHQKNALGIVHSHPNGPMHPSSVDMDFQVRTGLIVGLVTCGEGWVSDALWWGPGIAVPELVGRPFRHGPSGSDGAGDCFSLIKDFYEIHRGVKIPEFPRDWEWWTKDGGDLYVGGFPKAGFRAIRVEEAVPGDVFLACIRSTVPNHGGILWDEGSVLHHLVDRLSARTAHGPWARYITHWLRYEGDIPPWRA